jgi:hypothetical protein
VTQAASPPPVVGGGRGRRRTLVFVVLGVLVVIGIGAGVVLAGSGGGDGDGGGEILLEAAGRPGPNPFTPSVAPATPAEAAALVGAEPESGVSPAAGASLFGGSGDDRVCDREAMVRFFAAHPAQARAWARVAGVEVALLPTYVRSLTPTVLLYDTRVTNHGFVDGRATPRQSVLQAGTAVLVDEMGQLVAKCKCGNPLRPPVKTTSAPRYQGASWPGFTSSATVAAAPPSAGQEDAIRLVETAVKDCYEKIILGGSEGGRSAIPASVFSAVPTDQPGVFTVTRRTPNGASFEWSVDTRTGKATPVNDAAKTFTAATNSESGASCEKLFAGTGKPATTTVPPQQRKDEGSLDGTYAVVTSVPTCSGGASGEAGQGRMIVAGDTVTFQNTSAGGLESAGSVDQSRRTIHIEQVGEAGTVTFDATIDRAGAVAGTGQLNFPGIGVTCQFAISGQREG